MADLGYMAVDWEQRINFDRLRRERLGKAKAALDASDLNALLILRFEDARYLTGFRCHMGPVATAGLLVVGVLPRGAEPVLFTMDYEWARQRMTWLDGDQLQPPVQVDSPDGAEEFARRLKALKISLEGRIGVDIWTPPIENALKSAFPKAEFVDGYSVLLRAKAVKTEDEIDCLKAAYDLTEAGMEAALQTLRPGVRECQVLAEAWRAMTALGSEWTQCSNIVCSGPNTAPYRRLTGDRVILKGDPVIIDIGGCYNGYWGDFTRVYVCGDAVPSKEQVKLHQASYDSLFAACEAAVVSNTTADVYRAAEPNILWLLGHGSGTSPWEPPLLTPDNREPLVPMMEFSIEPYVGRPGVGGFRLENNLVIRAEGPEIFTRYPFDERLLDHTHRLDVTTGWGAARRG